MIGILKEVDNIEKGITECEKNGKIVFELLARICKYESK